VLLVLSRKPEPLVLLLALLAALLQQAPQLPGAIQEQQARQLHRAQQPAQQEVSAVPGEAPELRAWPHAPLLLPTWLLPLPLPR